MLRTLSINQCMLIVLTAFFGAAIGFFFFILHLYNGNSRMDCDCSEDLMS